jgi:glycosyltransferase involved in cell wall biosynthesis
MTAASQIPVEPTVSSDGQRSSEPKSTSSKQGGLAARAIARWSCSDHSCTDRRVCAGKERGALGVNGHRAISVEKALINSFSTIYRRLREAADWFGSAGELPPLAKMTGMKDMRQSIFIFSEYFRGLNRHGLTGGTIAFYQAVTALAKAFDIKVFSFDPEPNPDNLGELSSKTIYLPPLKMGGLRLAATWNGTLRKAYEDAVADYGVPAAVIAGTDTLPLLAFPETRGIKRIAVLQGYENFGASIPGGSFVERIAGIKRSLKTQFISETGIRNAHLVVVNSHYMCRAAKARFKMFHAKVIYPPLSSAFFEHSVRFVDSNSLTVGFIARNSGKNLPFVISLAEAMPEANFRVFGSLVAVPPHPINVQFMGWFCDPIDMYSRASVWIVPSKWAEPFGMVSIEAQAAGRSVFVSDRGGLPETVPTPDHIVPGFDKTVWAHRITEAFKRPLTSKREFLSRFHADQTARHWRSAVAELFGV